MCAVMAGVVASGMSREVAALPQPEVRVLVFSKTSGFRHGSIEAGLDAVRQLGVANGFGVDATEDAAAFTATQLAGYDAVVFLSTTGDVLGHDQEAAFEDYVRNGGGYVGIHAAADTEHDWAWYGGLVGAYFLSHPEPQDATLLVEDPDHLSTAHLGDTWERFDEWYDFRDNPRDRVHVLLSVDPATVVGSEMVDDHPVAWCHDYDGGHAWYTALGHTDESWAEPAFLQHVLGGIRHAAGIGDADCSGNVALDPTSTAPSTSAADASTTSAAVASTTTSSTSPSPPSVTTPVDTASTVRVASRAGFSGGVRVDRDGEIELVKAYGEAHRGWAIPNTPETRCAIASGGKGFTALAVASLIEDGTLDLSTTARSVLGDDLPLIDDTVTVKHLMAHRSGIGDYLDEDAQSDISDYVMTVPVQELATTEQFLAELEGHPSKFPPDERFEYCNGEYVVLALIAERASGISYHDLVRQRVCAPAGMHDTDFLRSDELRGGVALGYVQVAGAWRTNVFHLPVLGNGDGGIYSTLADMHALWTALFAGRIIAPDLVAEMVRAHSEPPERERRYGLGFWLNPSGPALMLEGYDAGVSFRTTHDPAREITHTVVSNTSEGAWPLVERLNELLAE
ncbi:MAG TPA: ThuA domain-containing protein [Ilumatobacteraceae bacterium]|nr:ThuA domain-containing protein [Ilumatobacteraceae bacterium]